jgi:GntR family L-lactate dehydrogenase operon transcriptional regulator
MLAKGGRDDVVELLVARRCLEREVAKLAAERATAADVRKMEMALERQGELVARGQLGVDQDIRFHELLGKASRNRFLEALVSLLRRHGEYSSVITRIRSISGDRLVVDHWAILDAIKRRDSAAGIAAISSHIDKLINEVTSFNAQKPVAIRSQEKPE